MGPDRRDFISTAGAAAVFSLAGEAPKLRGATLNGQIGLGFIGSGIRGTQLIGDFKAIDGLRLLSVCDLYDGCLARAKEQIDENVAATKEYRAVLDRKDVDAVVIATPDHLHRRIVLDALSAGKHVYVEKPMTWSLDEGKVIMAAEKASGRILQVGSQDKTSAMTAKARELIKAHAIGDVTMVRMSNHRNNAQGAWKYEIPPDASEKTIDWSRFLGDRPRRPFDARTFFQWRCWWEFSGGVATDLFVHLLTWLHEVMDVKAPVSVASQGGLYYWKDGRTVPDVLNSIFEYEEGFIADMYVHLANSFPAPASVIMGTKGSLVFTGDKLIQYSEPVDHGVQGYGTMQWPKAAREAYFVAKGWSPEGRPLQELPRGKQPEEIAVERGNTHAEWFIRSLREGIPSKENSLEGHLAAGAAHVANAAYRRGKKLRWDWRRDLVYDA
jgi:predicted dehydrogenase